MTAEHITTPGQAEVDAARLLLARLGLSPSDLLQDVPSRSPAPTFAEYVPVVCAAVSAGTRRVYGSYWNRIVQHWGNRRLNEPTPSEIEHLAGYIRTHVVARRNARGGRSAAEHLIAALCCLYNHAIADGKITEADNPARKVAKPDGCLALDQACQVLGSGDFIEKGLILQGRALATHPAREGLCGEEDTG